MCGAPTEKGSSTWNERALVHGMRLTDCQWGACNTRTLALFPFLLRSSAFLALAALRFECSTRFKHIGFENYAGWGLGCVVGCWGRGRWPGCGRDWGGGEDGDGDGDGDKDGSIVRPGDVVRLGVLEGVEQGEGERGRWVCVA